MNTNCNNCGEPILVNGNYCANCGAKIKTKKLNVKLINIIIVSILIITILVATILIFILKKDDSSNSVSSTGNTTEISTTHRIKDSNLSDYYGIELEERYSDGELKSTIIYKYDENDVVKTAGGRDYSNDFFGEYMSDSKSREYCESYLYNIGVIRHEKYVFNDDGTLKEITELNPYECQDYLNKYNEDLRLKKRVDLLSFYKVESEDNDYSIFEYNSNDQLTSRKKHDYYDNIDKYNLTYEYDDNLLSKENANFLHGSYFKKSFEYDDNKNIKKCNIDFMFKGDDGIIATIENDNSDYEGNVILEYDNVYNNNNKISNIKLKVILNGKLLQEYDTSYEYDDNGNLVYEKVVTSDETVERKITYRKLKGDEYDKKLNKIQTYSYFINDGFLLDDNWLSYTFDDLIEEYGGSTYY